MAEVEDTPGAKELKYDAMTMLELSQNTASKRRPACLSNEFNNEIGLWSPELWLRHMWLNEEELLPMAQGMMSNNLARPRKDAPPLQQQREPIPVNNLNRRKGVDRLKSESGDDVVLSPQRGNFAAGCAGNRLRMPSPPSAPPQQQVGTEQQQHRVSGDRSGTRFESGPAGTNSLSSNSQMAARNERRWVGAGDRDRMNRPIDEDRSPFNQGYRQQRGGGNFRDNYGAGAWQHRQNGSAESGTRGGESWRQNRGFDDGRFRGGYQQQRFSAEDEPEWMTDGPESAQDTMELHGFDGGESEKKSAAEKLGREREARIAASATGERDDEKEESRTGRMPSQSPPAPSNRPGSAAPSSADRGKPIVHTVAELEASLKALGNDASATTPARNEVPSVDPFSAFAFGGGATEWPQYLTEPVFESTFGSKPQANGRAATAAENGVATPAATDASSGSRFSKFFQAPTTGEGAAPAQPRAQNASAAGDLNNNGAKGSTPNERAQAQLAHEASTSRVSASTPATTVEQRAQNSTGQQRFDVFGAAAKGKPPVGVHNVADLEAGFRALVRTQGAPSAASGGAEGEVAAGDNNRVLQSLFKSAASTSTTTAALPVMNALTEQDLIERWRKQPEGDDERAEKTERMLHAPPMGVHAAIPPPMPPAAMGYAPLPGAMQQQLGYAPPPQMFNPMMMQKFLAENMARNPNYMAAAAAVAASLPPPPLHGTPPAARQPFPAGSQQAAGRIASPIDFSQQPPPTGAVAQPLHLPPPQRLPLPPSQQQQMQAAAAHLLAGRMPPPPLQVSSNQLAVQQQMAAALWIMQCQQAVQKQLVEQKVKAPTATSASPTTAFMPTSVMRQMYSAKPREGANETTTAGGTFTEAAAPASTASQPQHQTDVNNAALGLRAIVKSMPGASTHSQHAAASGSAFAAAAQQMRSLSPSDFVRMMEQQQKIAKLSGGGFSQQSGAPPAATGGTPMRFPSLGSPGGIGTPMPLAPPAAFSANATANSALLTSAVRSTAGGTTASRRF